MSYFQTLEIHRQSKRSVYLNAFLMLLTMKYITLSEEYRLKAFENRMLEGGGGFMDPRRRK
jgi:hypothetical protein